jgi:hypothetical protein
MDTKQDMQVTRISRRQPTASLPWATTRRQRHQGDDRDDSLTMQAPCVSTLPVHCCARPMTPPLHGHRAGHAGYLYQEETAHRQPATGCTTPSTALGWLVPVGGCPTMQAPCVSTLPVHCCAHPMTPPLHGHRAGHAGYLYQEETAHRQPATGCTPPSTALGCHPVGAMCVRTSCALSCPLHDLSTPLTPGRTCRLPSPSGGCPPPASRRPHAAFNRLLPMDGCLTLCV